MDIFLKVKKKNKVIQTVLEYLVHTQSLYTTYIGLQDRMQTWSGC